MSFFLLPPRSSNGGKKGGGDNFLEVAKVVTGCSYETRKRYFYDTYSGSVLCHANFILRMPSWNK